ncbi:GNAT family protein [Paenibacillus sp. Marseille-Q4541]|uniref:GNAT family N-acetyltransferase n=1 Tax=Paenibacillus sp. Marseille-Q4541 TaxID=2831522 RepID=UPI0020191E0F|nr:GNAT family protein [Paenibacillus sp. Marseille-Q4541]
MLFTTMETERLIIREFEAGDWMDVHRYASDVRVTKYTLWGPNEEEDSKAFIQFCMEDQQKINRDEYSLAVENKYTGEFLGGVNIIFMGSNAEIGYCFHPDYWGKGYASEAASAMLKFGFEQPEVHRIYATCRPGNVGSSKVMKRIGMTQEGVLREHVFYNGEYHSSLLFSVLKQEYQTR